MKIIFYILIVFSIIIANYSYTPSSIDSQYQLAQDYRNKKDFDNSLKTLFSIKDVYLKANFDIAFIYYQEYKKYEIALEFFDFIINNYQSFPYEGEAFTDANNNAKYDEGEEFIDSNGNKIYDENLNLIVYKNSLFFSPYIYANDLELYSKAIEKYELFLDEFPNDDLTDDAIQELRDLSEESNQIELLKTNLK